MADSVVSFLLENLTQLLIQESKLLRGVEDQVRSLKNKLSLINRFLQNTEVKRHDELVKEVVSQIRDVSYEAEDVIDTFIITVTEHRRRSKLRKLIHSCHRAIAFHEVASKIESIKIINKEINDNRSKYGIEIAESSGGDAEAEEILHRRRKHVEEDQVVSFAHDAEILVKELMEGSLQRNVVSIIGMGGLGKTTLAWKIYNNNDVKNYFKFRGSNNDKLKGKLTEDLKRFKEMNDEEFRKAWSEFLEGVHNDLKNSLSNFVQDFYSKNGVKLKDMTEDELKCVLLESLKDKRYLLWMTSGILKYGMSVPPILPYELPLLEKDKSWELFSKKVFGEGTYSPELETLGRQLVKNCHGLPLAIVVLGGKSHRISIHYGNNPYISSSPCKPSNNRSIIVFKAVVEHECPVDKSYLKWICKSNKLVRVVELSNTGICCLISKGIEKLVLLRYLSISSGELHVIPNSICNLWNLETLDMRNSTVKTKCLPTGIWKLQRLRHLYLDGQHLYL
uniref:Uncharacterized protein n=1 Tax=Quercus lobata TaxID=97700 RepID=A0A7N2MYB0_QUELO